MQSTQGKVITGKIGSPGRKGQYGKGLASEERRHEAFAFLQYPKDAEK